ncbi:MAG: (d)CMP kinase [Jatrophihabitans sp.]
MRSDSDGTGFSGVVALDGPSGTGKSSAARQLAERIGARYLDTGAMYRAATVAVLRAGASLSDAGQIGAVVEASDLEISTTPRPAVVTLDGSDVTTEIRSAEVTQAVSAVSAVPAVRTRMVAQQRGLIGTGGIIVEGRDIGSTVWPQAEVKVYLTASEAARAGRRAAENAGQSEADVAASLRRRDALDSGRAVSPLRRADGALELDTTDLTLAEVVDQLAGLVAASRR